VKPMVLTSGRPALAVLLQQRRQLRRRSTGAPPAPSSAKCLDHVRRRSARHGWPWTARFERVGWHLGRHVERRTTRRTRCPCSLARRRWPRRARTGCAPRPTWPAAAPRPPARCCRNSPTGPDTEATCPPIRSAIAGCVPGEGTCFRSHAGPRVPNSSATKCGTEPAAATAEVRVLRVGLAPGHESRPGSSRWPAPSARPRSRTSKRTACDTGWKSATGS